MVGLYIRAYMVGGWWVAGGGTIYVCVYGRWVMGGGWYDYIYGVYGRWMVGGGWLDYIYVRIW